MFSGSAAISGVSGEQRRGIEVDRIGRMRQGAEIAGTDALTTRWPPTQRSTKSKPETATTRHEYAHHAG